MAAIKSSAEDTEICPEKFGECASDLWQVLTRWTIARYPTCRDKDLDEAEQELSAQEMEK